MFGARGLHLGDDFAASLLVIACIPVGNAQQDDADQLAAFAGDQQEALPCFALEARQFRGVVHHLRIFEGECESVEAAFRNDESEHIGFGRTCGDKFNLHGNSQPFRWALVIAALYRPIWPVT